MPLQQPGDLLQLNETLQTLDLSWNLLQMQFGSV